MNKLVVAVSVALSVVSGAALSQEHEHKGQLGRVKFATSCSPQVQPLFETGVAMLHSFYYSAAEKTFREVLAKEPSCTIATWGLAAILMGNPLGGQGATPKWVEAARAAIDQGRKNPPKGQRERDYLEALAAKYPDDDEAQIFSALYIAGTQTQADQTYAAYLRAAAIIEKQFAKYPEHPGVAHYLIHSYDAPPIASKGLDAARRYAKIAPSAPHALHMPSHIFTHVGSWEEAAATNLRSVASAKANNEPNESYHASDYAVYAFLQLGRDGDAKRTMEEAFRVDGWNAAVRTAPYARAAMPARMALDRGQWREAMQLQPTATKYPYTDAITYFARAIGAARSGDVAAAEKDAAELARLHKTLEAARDNYWATEVEVQRLTAAAWIAHAQGKTDDALKLMRAAADIEDKNEKSIVTPARILPARELLADMLMELKQPALALKEYETSQVREPNRYRGYAGAARAAEAAGERTKAAEHYRKLLQLAKNADGQRPEIARARAYIAQR